MKNSKQLAYEKCFYTGSGTQVMAYYGIKHILTMEKKSCTEKRDF